MIRRRFLGLMTFTGVSGIAAFSAKSFGERQTVTYKIRGFTCITCATGLETLLQRKEGVLSVRASYPEGLAAVVYDVKSTSPEEIRKLIEEIGFKAEVK